MSPARATRPPALRSVCLYLGMISLFQVFRGLDVLTAWTSIEGQEARKPLLDTLADSGIDRLDAETAYRVVTIVATGIAAMTVVFVVYTARGDRTSRVWVSAFTVLVAVWASTGNPIDRIFGIFALLCLFQLWTGEIRRFFAPEGSELKRRLDAEHEARVSARAAAVAAKSTAAPPVVLPASPDPSSAQSAPTWAPSGHPPQGWAPPPGRDKAPRSVLVAGWTAFVGSLLVLGVSTPMLAVLAISGGDFGSLLPADHPLHDYYAESSMSGGEVRLWTIIFGAAAVVALPGVVASIGVLTRKAWARTFLFATSIVTVVLGAVTLVGLPFAAAAVVVLLQLQRPETKAWFVRT